MKYNYICIAGKNSIAVDAIEFLQLNYNKDFTFLGLPNASDNGIDNWQPSFRKKLNELKIKIVSLNELYEIDNLIFISLEFDKIIKPDKFKTNKLYNIHFSYLPSYKGMYTSAIPILNNEEYTGVTLHYIDKGIDTGEIISQIKFSIGKSDDSLNLYQKYNHYAFQLFKENIQNLITGNYTPRKQSFKNSSYYSKKSIDYAKLKIDFNQTAEAIHNQIRAFAFRPYQLPKFNKSTIRFSKITSNISDKSPGEIINEDFFTITIASIDYSIILYRDCLESILKAIRNKENELVKKYIDFGYPLNDKDINGWDMLIVATYSANQEIFDLLLRKGANIKTSNYKKTNLLMYALTPLENDKNTYFINKLSKLGLDLKAKDSKGLSTFDWMQRRNIKFEIND